LCLLCATDPATTGAYPLSLHDALPISSVPVARSRSRSPPTGTISALGVSHPVSVCPVRLIKWTTVPTGVCTTRRQITSGRGSWRSEEHTSELQSRENLVCRLLLEKKKK